MNTKFYQYLCVGLVCCAISAALTACSEDLNAPVLHEPQSVTMPEPGVLDPAQLFGVWGATTSVGTTADTYFEQTYQVEFQSVADGEAVYSHWYTDAASETRDSLCNIEYEYIFNGSTVEMTPKAAFAAAGARTIKAIYTGNNQLVMMTFNASKTDTICTLRRIGDPEPCITSVNHTLPQPGETITISGRNLQFVDHVYLPTTSGEIEVTDFEAGSKQIRLVVPQANYTAGSVRCQSTTAHVSCYSPAYMFCHDCVFMHNFNKSGSEFSYTISSMGTLVSKAVNLSSTNLPSGHCLTNTTNIFNPDSLLSIFGNTPINWPVSTKTDNTSFGYIRFSSGDRFQYVIDQCDGLLTSHTACEQVAIQMDIYVSTNGQPVWNTGYVQYRLNKDQSSLTSAMVANVASWEQGTPDSFTDGWHTLTIPLTAFSAAKGNTLGDLISTLKDNNLQTILTLVNYPMDSMHPAQDVTDFQFNLANIRLVPYYTPNSRKE